LLIIRTSPWPGAFEALAAFEASFTVEDFVLYVHVDGAWTPRSSFHLRG